MEVRDVIAVFIFYPNASTAIYRSGTERNY